MNIGKQIRPATASSSEADKWSEAAFSFSFLHPPCWVLLLLSSRLFLGGWSSILVGTAWCGVLLIFSMR